ncbi:MAG TPA: hypothetical protein VEB23_16770, partial [Ramlibacter sp.]|nr:hypothetical protein [Ramlibacter sp.]
MSGSGKKRSGFVQLPPGLRGDFTTASLRSLRIFMGALALVALALFAAFAAYRYGQLEEQAQVRLQHTVNLAHEHALRVLDTNETLLRFALSLVRGEEDAAIVAQRPLLHAQLREMAQGKPQVQAIWVHGADGRPLVGSRFPAPPAHLDVSGSAHFAWHRDKLGGVAASRLVDDPQGPYFDISRGLYRG